MISMNPNFLHIVQSIATSLSPIKFFHKRDQSDAARRAVIARQHKEECNNRRGAKACIEKTSMQTAATLSNELQRRTRRLVYKDGSLFRLFGIKSSCRSPVMTKHLLKKLQFSGRYFIVKSLLLRVPPKGNLVLTRRAASEIWNEFQKDCDYCTTSSRPNSSPNTRNQ